MKSNPGSACIMMLKLFSRSIAVLCVLGALGACSSRETITGSRGKYVAKGDARPHPGVAHAQNYVVHGIDVSKWQGEIDWEAVRGSGVRFAFIKATEGGDYVDPRFLTNWNGARAAGVQRGAYHFVYWCRPAHEQVVWFRQHIPNDADAMPPVLDVEWNTVSKTCPQKISPDLAREKIQLMLQELEAHTGKRPIIYTDIPFHKEVLAGYFNEYPFWIRSTASDPSEKYENRRWTIWQYTTTGRVPGIRGDVDKNTFAGDHRQWLAFSGEKPQTMVAERAPAAKSPAVAVTAYAAPVNPAPAVENEPMPEAAE
jgi:lysozyme